MTDFRVGVDSYCLDPLQMDAFTLMEWVEASGGDGVQFSHAYLPPGRSMDEGFLRELAGAMASAGLYLEWGGGQHVPFDTTTSDDVYVPFVNQVATGTSVSNTYIYSAAVEGRFVFRLKGFKPFSSDQQIGSNGLSVAAVRTADAVVT